MTNQSAPLMMEHPERIQDAPHGTPSQVTVSVVIPALNEGRNIADVLAALEQQTLPQSSFEVLVIDNGSKDDTVEKAKAFLHRLPLTVLCKERCTISALRNAGAEASHGEILAFLDADCIPPPSWLEAAVRNALPGAIWGAHYDVPKDATWIGNTWFTHQATQKSGEVTFVPAGDLLIHKNDFQRIGGFNEQLQTSEDVELALRARGNGLRVLALTELAVVHRGTPRSLGHFYRQNRWHGTHVLRMFFNNFPSRKNLVVVSLSLFTLVMFWLTVLAAPVALYLHKPWVFLACLVALLLPPCALAILKGVQGKTIADIPALFVLYTAYLLSRAAAVLQLSQRNHR